MIRGFLPEFDPTYSIILKYFVIVAPEFGDGWLSGGVSKAISVSPHRP
jgi:hypothetical protein